jgi:hypothetical protein
MTSARAPVRGAMGGVALRWGGSCWIGALCAGAAVEPVSGAAFQLGAQIGEDAVLWTALRQCRFDYGSTGTTRRRRECHEFNHNVHDPGGSY